MTKPPQQTIGNTVYNVGQVVTVDEMRDAPHGTQFEVEPPTAIYAPQYLKFRITALPNPDPMEDEWRVVEMQKFQMIPVNPETWLHKSVSRDFGEQIQLAMQEVVKADEVKLEWPLKNAPEEFIYGVNLACYKDIALCFLLGGVVKVRGCL